MIKVNRTYFAICILIVLCSSVYAQHRKDTVQLDEVKITDYRSKTISENFQELRSDSTTRSVFSNSNMQQMLMQQNGSFIKSYGPANIAFMSIRGSSAQQTAVVWNGLNINNPMIGQADISLLPVMFFNSVSLQKGALSGYWGSGAMAGVLNLQSNAKKDVPLTITASTSYSSLQNSVNWASANFSDTRRSCSIKIFSDESKNQYNFLNGDSGIIKQRHAETKQTAVMQDWSLSVNEKQQIGLHFWGQEVQRQIPATLSGQKYGADQHDQILRGMIDWKLSEEKYSLSAKAAVFNEALIYDDTAYHTSSNSSFKTFMADVEGRLDITENIKLMAGSTNSISYATTEGYGKGLYQISRYALYENLSVGGKISKVLAYFRQEVFNSSGLVPTAGITETVNIYKWISWKINLGTIYRYPTLNDLYWSPGGNKDLKPEKGLSGETSLLLNPRAGKFDFLFNATWFSREISNCIIWLPSKGGNWSPQNVQQVWSRGCETNSGVSFNGKHIKTSVNVITNYVLSTRKQTLLENDGSSDKQMPYVPMYSGSSVFSFQYKNWMLRLAYTYTGYRYLSSDNYSYLTPFSILDARIARTFVLKNVLLNVFAEGNNLLNENYQAYAQYPMPLRNLKMGIILQFQKQNKKS